MRLATIYYLSRAHVSTVGEGAGERSPVHATRIAAQVLAYVRLRIRQDFARASLPDSVRAAFDSSCMPGGRGSRLDFQARWGTGAGGVLSSSPPGDSSTVQVLLSQSFPVPLPHMV